MLMSNFLSCALFVFWCSVVLWLLDTAEVTEGILLLHGWRGVDITRPIGTSMSCSGLFSASPGVHRHVSSGYCLLTKVTMVQYSGVYQLCTRLGDLRSGMSGLTAWTRFRFDRCSAKLLRTKHTEDNEDIEQNEGIKTLRFTECIQMSGSLI